MDKCGVLFRLDSRFQAAAGAKLPILDGVRRNTFRSPGHQEDPHDTRSPERLPRLQDTRKAPGTIGRPPRPSGHQEGLRDIRKAPREPRRGARGTAHPVAPHGLPPWEPMGSPNGIPHKNEHTYKSLAAPPAVPAQSTGGGRRRSAKGSQPT